MITVFVIWICMVNNSMTFDNQCQTF